jgi:hypothetical protein
MTARGVGKKTEGAEQDWLRTPQQQTTILEL